uniref:Uncharacterized protein n=1 Tax=Timema genevievae TaxID=629358 RepID=A0A7R9K5B9_TIMGE|nr:unnamed protein product [Timema genevievae]
MKFSCFPSIFSDKETWTLEPLSSDKRPGSFTKIDPDNRHDDNQSSNGSAFEKVVNGRHVSVFVNNKFSTCPKPPRIAVVDVIKRKASDVDIPFYQKDQSSEDLIKSAIMANEFLNNLEPNQIDLVVGAMYHKELDENTFIITEDEQGKFLSIYLFI